jgi:hypothetical protein
VDRATYYDGASVVREAFAELDESNREQLGGNVGGDTAEGAEIFL